MMFEAMAFKFCPLHIKLSTSNFKFKLQIQKGLVVMRQALFYYSAVYGKSAIARARLMATVSLR